jgi:outer membrane protein OmpA-like peptidoglycan-associated protein
MAQFEVQPKKSNPWWLWLLFAIIAIVILLLLLKGCNDKTTTVVTKQADTTQAVAITQPVWDSVDFNSPKLTAVDTNITDAGIAISGTEKYTIYSLGENILFAPDQNKLQASADSKLKQISASLKNNFKNAAIGVYGNTDDLGTAGHNKQLGADRAEAVKNWLISNGGFSATNVSVHSMGEKKPVATNTTAAGRRQNRNVEIVVFADHK